MAFQLEVERHREVLLLRCSGELDHQSAEQIRRSVEEQMARGTLRHLLLSFRGLSFVDSAGIGVILGRYKKLTAAGGKMVLCEVQPSLRRLLELSGILKIMPVFNSEADALRELGVSYLFSNLGSDHPTIIEALAQAKEANKKLPEVIICPHESVALSAAHGYALQTGQAQGVVVHTDVGTQNLGGSVHNAFRGRVPVFIFAGETPYTLEGELPLQMAAAAWPQPLCP